MAKKKLTMMEAQQAAQKFITGHISTQNLGLPKELDEAVFSSVMDAIVRAMMNAWADGYYTAVG